MEMAVESEASETVKPLADQVFQFSISPSWFHKMSP